MTAPTPEQFDLILARVTRALARAGIPCTSIAPTASGDLALRIGAGKAAGTFTWSSAEAPARGDRRALLLGRAVTGPRGLPAGAVSVIVRHVGDVIAREGAGVMARLDRRNRELAEIPGDANGVFSIVAQHLGPGAQAWGPWIFEGVRAEGEGAGLRFVFTFSAGDTSVSCALSPGAPAGTGRTAIIDTPLGSLGVVHDTRDAAMRRDPAGRIERMLAFVLATGVHAGMRWTAPRQPTVQAGTAAAPAASAQGEITGPLQSWNPWRFSRGMFFAPWGDEDFFLRALMYSRGIDHVCHGGRECPAGSPHFPDIPDAHAPSPWRLTYPREKLDRTSISDVDDHAMIFGGEDRLRDQLARRTAAPLLMVTSHCEYEFIGDRVSEIVEAEPGADRGRVMHLVSPLPQFVRGARRLKWWHTVVDRIPAEAGEKSPGAVNLVGFAQHGDPALEELGRLLGAVGLRTGEALFPTFDPGTLARFAAAPVSVARPWTPVMKVIAPLLAERGIALEAPPAPYGFAGTRRWLDAVTRAAGASTINDAAWETLCDELAPGRAALLEAARGLPIAFVFDEDHLAEGITPGFFFGIDWLALLEEFGCAVTILVRGSGARPGIANALETAHCGLRITACEPAAPITPALRATGCRLVYSDVPFNRLVIDAGAVPLGIGALRMGLRGAAATLRWLVAAGRVDFFSRYAHLLT